MCGWRAGLLGSNADRWAAFVEGKEGLLRWSIRSEMARSDPALSSASRNLVVEDAEALAWERFFLEKRSRARYADDLDRRLILLGRWCEASVLREGGAGKRGSREARSDAIAYGAGPLQLAEVRDDLRRVAEIVCRTLARMPPARAGC